MKKLKQPKDNPNGIHYLIEFFGCDEKQIDSMEFWKKLLLESIMGTSMEVLHSYFHQFKPQGITGFLLLSNSHISVHTWPDKGYVACDIFTCSSEKETGLAFERLKKAVICDHMNVEKIHRGYQFLNLPIFYNGEMMKVEINNILYEIESDFQKIIIADTKEFGKSLIIDGVLQASVTDHEIYDREILKKLKKTDNHMLIIGGGDGYVAQMALHKNPKMKIDIIDLDVEVINSAKKFLDQKIFDNKNVNLLIGDALNFLKHSKKEYDCVVCDLTDAPIGTENEVDKFKEFFGKIIPFSEKVLARGGWISVQGGSSVTAPCFIDEAAIIENILKKKFNNILRSDVFIPSYGESCVFLFGEKK